MEIQPILKIEDESYDINDFIEDFPIWDGDDYIGCPIDDENEEI